MGFLESLSRIALNKPDRPYSIIHTNEADATVIAVPKHHQPISELPPEIVKQLRGIALSSEHLLTEGSRRAYTAPTHLGLTAERLLVNTFENNRLTGKKRKRQAIFIEEEIDYGQLLKPYGVGTTESLLLYIAKMAGQLRELNDERQINPSMLTFLRTYFPSLSRDHIKAMIELFIRGIDIKDDELKSASKAATTFRSRVRDVEYFHPRVREARKAKHGKIAVLAGNGHTAAILKGLKDEELKPVPDYDTWMRESGNRRLHGTAQRIRDLAHEFDQRHDIIQ